MENTQEAVPRGAGGAAGAVTKAINHSYLGIWCPVLRCSLKALGLDQGLEGDVGTLYFSRLLDTLPGPKWGNEASFLTGSLRVQGKPAFVQWVRGHLPSPAS